MDVLAVKKSIQYAREVALSGQPILVEYDTYRYVGHSMSDPGTSYRTRDDVRKVRESRDPIMKLKARLLDSQLAKEEDLKAMESEIKAEVDQAVAAAKAASFPATEALFKSIYVEPTPVRHVELEKTYHPTQ